MTVSRVLTCGAEWVAHIAICLIAAAAVTGSLSPAGAYSALGLLLAGTAATFTASILDKRTTPSLLGAGWKATDLPREPRADR